MAVEAIGAVVDDPFATTPPVGAVVDDPFAAEAPKKTAPQPKPLIQDIADTAYDAWQRSPIPTVFNTIADKFAPRGPTEDSRNAEEFKRRADYDNAAEANRLFTAPQPQKLFSNDPKLDALGWRNIALAGMSSQPQGALDAQKMNISPALPTSVTVPYRAVGGLAAQTVGGAVLDPATYLTPEFKALHALSPIASHAVSAGLGNFASDLVSQSAATIGGAQKKFDPKQLMTSTALGAGFGAGVGGLTEGFKAPLETPKAPEEISNAVEGAKNVASDLQGSLAPESKPLGKKAAAIVRREAGRAEYEIALVGEKLRPLYQAVEKMDPETKLKLYSYPEGTPTEKRDMMLTPEQAKIGDTISQIYRKHRENVQRSLNPEEWPDFVENYAAHIWEDPAADVKATYENISPTYMVKTGSGQNLLKRKFPTIKEGLEAGLKLKYDNPLDATMAYTSLMSRYLKHRRILRAIQQDPEIAGDWMLPSEAKGLVRVEGPGTVKGVPPGYGRGGGRGGAGAGGEEPTGPNAPSGAPQLPPGGRLIADNSIPKDLPGPAPRPKSLPPVSVFGDTTTDAAIPHKVFTAPKAVAIEGEQSFAITPAGKIAHLTEGPDALRNAGKTDVAEISSSLANGKMRLRVSEPEDGWTEAGKKAVLRLIAAAKKAGHDVAVTFGDRTFASTEEKELRYAVRAARNVEPPVEKRAPFNSIEEIEQTLRRHDKQIREIDRKPEVSAEEQEHYKALKKARDDLAAYLEEKKAAAAPVDEDPMPDFKTDPQAFDEWVDRQNRKLDPNAPPIAKGGEAREHAGAGPDVPLSNGSSRELAKPGAIEEPAMPDPREDPEGFRQWVAARDYARHGGKPPPPLQIEGPKTGKINKDPRPAPNLYFYAHPDAARIINSHIKRGLEGNAVFRAVNRASNFMKMYTLALDVFHGVATALHSTANTAAEGVTEAARLRPVSAAKRFAAAPLSWARLAAEGVKMRKQMLHRIARSPAEKAIQDAYVRAGGRLEMDEIFKAKASRTFYDAIQSKTFWKTLKNEATTGWKDKPVGKTIDLAANVVQSAMAPLFQWYIPRLKLGAFSEAMRNWGARHPNATQAEFDAQSRRMVDSIDNRFGEAIDDNIFWSKILKQIARVILLSPSWNKGLVVELGGGALDIPKSVVKALKGEDISTRTAYLIGLASTVAVINGLMTYLQTGETPEGEDFMAYRTGGVTADGAPERAMIPGHQKDVYAFAHEGPGGLPREVRNKLSPALSAVGELMANEDYKGDNIYRPAHAPKLADDEPTLLDYIADMFIPIGVQNVQAGRNAGSKIGPIQRGAGVKQAPRYIQNPELAAAIKQKQDTRSWVKTYRDKKRIEGRNSYGQDTEETPVGAVVDDPFADTTQRADPQSVTGFPTQPFKTPTSLAEAMVVGDGDIEQTSPFYADQSDMLKAAVSEDTWNSWGDGDKVRFLKMLALNDARPDLFGDNTPIARFVDMLKRGKPSRNVEDRRNRGYAVDGRKSEETRAASRR